MKSILLNTFAVIGFGTFIFLACSVDDIDSTENNNNNSEIITNNYGKYQVESYGDNENFVVLNTETGVMKTYMRVNNGGNWVENPNYPEITFTH